VALLDLFNDIHIPRFSSDGERIDDFIVPIKFGSRGKAYQLNDHEIENLTNGNVNILPRMSMELNSINKAQNRDTNKNSKINKRVKDVNKLIYEYHHNARAFDFDYVLNIATRTLSDLSIVLEQILPMFRPDYTLKIWELDIQEESTSIPIEIGDPDIEIPDEEDDEIRILKASIPIKLKGNLYLPIKDAGVIKEMNLNIRNIEAQRDEKGNEYEIEYPVSKIEADAQTGQTSEDIDDIPVTKTDEDILKPE